MNKIRTIKIALLFSLLVIITSVVLLVLTVGPPSSSTLNGLKFDGEVLVKQIEEYKRINREYPKTLAQGGISNSESRYGGWRYTLENDSNTYLLSIGKYENDLFVLYWNSETGDWYLDS